MAANASTAMTVAPKSGHAVCFTTATAALVRSMPCWRRTSMPSTTTMALSTSMPSAMISAPSEIRSSVTPAADMKMKLPAIVRNSTKPMSRPLRRPMKNSSTTMTIATACSRLTTKLCTATCTLSDCREMTPNSMPRGI